MGWLEPESESLDVVTPRRRAMSETKVLAWRIRQLLQAGYPRPLAVALGERPWHGVDLHVACELPSRGCPHELAAEILL